MSEPMGEEIVGRDAELSRLRRALEQTGDGSGSATVFVGEPGIGKSRLLAVTAAAARAAGIPAFVLRMPCPPSDLAEAIEHAGKGDPLLVALDDLHFAPAVLAPAVDTLLALSTSRPLLLLLAYRPRQMFCKVGSVLSGAVDSGVLQEHTLAGLTLAQARQLLGHRDDLEEIHRDGEGNPLYLQVLANPTGPAAVAVLSELSVLTASELRVAQIAAIVGDPFTADMLTALTPTDPAETLATLDRLAAMDVIRAGSSAVHLSFRHPMIGRAVYDRIDISRRRAIHQDVDAMLAGVHASPMRRAHHIAQFFDPSVPEHVEILLAGARELLEADPRTVKTWLTTACAALAGHDPRWVEAQLLLARAELLRGSPQEPASVA